jgi:hypothetical protein
MTPVVEAAGLTPGLGGTTAFGTDASLALGAGAAGTEAAGAGAGAGAGVAGDVLGSWSGWGLGADAVGSSLGIGATGTSAASAGSSLLGGGGGGGSNLLGTLLNTGAIAGLGYLSGEEAQENAEETAEKNYALWNQYAWPNAGRVNSMLMQNYSQLADQLRSGKESLMEDYAQRGIKGGGIVGGGLASLDRAAMSERAKALQGVLEFANTPYFSPSGASIQNTESGMSNVYDTLGTLGSMYLYNNLLGSGNNNNSGNDYYALLLSQMLQ